MTEQLQRHKVLQVITRLNVGGPARHTLLLNERLPAYGFDSELVFGRERKREGRLDPKPGAHAVQIATLRRPLNPLNDTRALRALAALIADRRPSIVHTHTAKAGALGRWAAWRANVPVRIHTYHGHVFDGYFPEPVARTYIAVERALARRSTALIAVSPQIRDELLELGIGREDQWHVLSLGLELEALLASSLQRPDARRRLGLGDNGPLVGIVGRLEPIKDVETFLDAAARITQVRDDVTFVVAGDGEMRSKLEAKGRELLGPRVRFLGWVEDLESLYAALDVVVLTSLNEGTPVALIEAGAVGRPVVATRVGGVPDVVSNGRTGTLVPPSDPQAVATQVVHLLENDRLAAAFGEAARERIGRRFGVREPIDHVAELYRWLLDTPYSRNR